LRDCDRNNDISIYFRQHIIWNMIPGMNPRMMKQAMRRMGIQQQEVDAVEVIIKTKDSIIVFPAPEVSKVNMMGQVTWQILGDYEEKELSKEPEINADDIKTVMEQTGVTEEKAKEIIKKNNGDLAASIMELQEE
jgi:nascent polypeptide-associated complex subunit alpha